MATGTFEKSIVLPGISLSTRATRTASGQESRDPVLPAGKAGTLTTRTDDDTGVITVAEGHGITDADTVDVYWEGGMRYGMAVTATTDTTVSVDVGVGDNLPAEGFAVVVTKRVEVDLDFTGNDLKMIAAYTDQRAHIEFLTSVDASIDAEELVSGEGFDWVSGQGVTNPFADAVVGKVQASCGVATASTQLMLGVLFESAP